MIPYVSSGIKTSIQVFLNVNYYVLSIAKGIVEDREVKDMARPQGSYRTGEITNPP